MALAYLSEFISTLCPLFLGPHPLWTLLFFEYTKSPEKDFYGAEISNLPDKEFK